MMWWQFEASGHGYGQRKGHRNYGLAGGTLDPSKHLRRARDRVLIEADVCETVVFSLEVPWMVQWAEHHANWGV